MSYRAGSLLPRWHWNVIADITVLFSVWSAILVFANFTSLEYRSDLASWALVAVTVGTTGIGFWLRSLYETPRLARTEEISRIISTTLMGAGLMVVAASLANLDLGARELVIATPIAIAALILGRGTVGRVRGQTGNQRIVIVGTGAEAKEILHLLSDHPESALEVVGVIGDPRVAREHGLGESWLGPVPRLIEIMGRHRATGAIITPTGFRNLQFREITRTLFDAGLDIHLSTGVTHIYSGRFEVRPVVHEPLVRLTNHRPYPFERILKRVLDIVGASFGLLLASPFMIAAAIAIKVEDGGPVLFRQTRKATATTTSEGEVVIGNFEMLKFRSMVIDAEAQRKELALDNERSGPIFKVSEDPRVTRIGGLIRELSIDELPQLVNVLRGEMSLVGPRPALEAEEKLFDTEHKRRFAVKPGITGLWQVEARANREFRAYRRLDLHYVENWSVSLDLKILVATTAFVIVELLLFPFRRLLPPNISDGVRTRQPEPTTIDLRTSESVSQPVTSGVLNMDLKTPNFRPLPTSENGEPDVIETGVG